MATLRFTVGFMVFLVAFAFRRTHAPAWWYGVILAASVGGNLIGATIAPRLRGRVREEYIVAGSLTAVVVAGVLLVPFDVFQRRPAACVLAAVIGIAAGAGKLAFDSLVQQEVPAAAQGRVFGRLEAMFQLVWVLGALVPVLIALSLDEGNLVVAVVTAAALVIFLTGLGMARHDHLPDWWPGIGHRPAATTPAIGGAVGAPVVDAAPPGAAAGPLLAGTGGADGLRRRGARRAGSRPEDSTGQAGRLRRTGVPGATGERVATATGRLGPTDHRQRAGHQSQPGPAAPAAPPAPVGAAPAVRRRRPP